MRLAFDVVLRVDGVEEHVGAADEFQDLALLLLRARVLTRGHEFAHDDTPRRGALEADSSSLALDEEREKTSTPLSTSRIASWDERVEGGDGGADAEAFAEHLVDVGVFDRCRGCRPLLSKSWL